MMRACTLLQTLLYKRCGVLWVSGQMGGQFGFNALRRVQFNHALNGRIAGLGMLGIGDDPNLGSGTTCQQIQQQKRNEREALIPIDHH